MTSFNSPAVLMPLDDYYDHFVLPKPNIPKRYPGFTGNKKKKREAAHLQSYKDNSDVEDEDEEEEDKSMLVDEFNSSIQDSNRNQIDFETNEFNQLYEASNDSIDIKEKPSTPAVTDTPAGSAQWRLQANNVNRPAGAAPLVPHDAPRGNLQSAAGRGQFNSRRRRNNRYGPHNNNNRNNTQQSVHCRLGYDIGVSSQRAQFPVEQPMRSAYNNLNNNANVNMQQQVMMNMQNHFNSGQLQTLTLNSLASNQRPNYNAPNSLLGNNLSFNMNESRSSNFVVDNNMTSLIRSANQLGHKTVNNTLARLGPYTQGQVNQTNLNPQLQRVSNNGVVASDSLRLADLINMNQSSSVNLNVAEVVKSAMFLLSSVYHKPILNEDVQQQLYQLQRNNGLREEPNGVDMVINPKSTDITMSHRFK